MPVHFMSIISAVRTTWGLTSPQVVRTAEMMDMKCIVFVRGKQPDGGILELADDRQLVVMATKERMYNACGLLYLNGLRE